MIKATVSLDNAEKLYLEMLHNQNILAPIKLIKMGDIKEGDNVFNR